MQLTHWRHFPTLKPGWQQSNILLSFTPFSPLWLNILGETMQCGLDSKIGPVTGLDSGMCSRRFLKEHMHKWVVRPPEECKSGKLFSWGLSARSIWGKRKCVFKFWVVFAFKLPEECHYPSIWDCNHFGAESSCNSTNDCLKKKKKSDNSLELTIKIHAVFFKRIKN